VPLDAAADALSPREQDLLRLVAAAAATPNSSELVLSVRSVGSHLANLYARRARQTWAVAVRCCR
jgi:hypothetical protein